jgi:hypothetical protein
VISDQELLAFMRTIADGDETTATGSLSGAPQLATARLTTGGTRATSEEYFLSARHLQLYAGDTALHVAAASYDTTIARKLIATGADVRARNRRGATPLHAAVVGVPGSSSWDPRRQAAVIRSLISAGAEIDAAAAGGVTPLHRAVRNRCSAAVRALLDAGADPHRPNDNGSLAIDLARVPTGRGGTGSPEAKAEQNKIRGLLDA